MRRGGNRNVTRSSKTGFHELGFWACVRVAIVGARNRALLLKRNGRTAGTATCQLESPMSSVHRIRVLVLHGDPVAQAGLSVAFGRYPDLEVEPPQDPLERESAPDSGAAAMRCRCRGGGLCERRRDGDADRAPGSWVVLTQGRGRGGNRSRVGDPQRARKRRPWLSARGLCARRPCARRARSASRRAPLESASGGAPGGEHFPRAAGRAAKRKCCGWWSRDCATRRSDGAWESRSARSSRTSSRPSTS